MHSVSFPCDLSLPHVDPFLLHIGVDTVCWADFNLSVLLTLFSFSYLTPCHCHEWLSSHPAKMQPTTWGVLSGTPCGAGLLMQMFSSVLRWQAHFELGGQTCAQYLGPLMTFLVLFWSYSKYLMSGAKGIITGWSILIEHIASIYTVILKRFKKKAF